MAAFLDHYRTLGVHRDAEPEVIQAAYRAIVRRYHPDINRSDSSAEERLKQANIAYEVLSDAQRRRTYNRDWDAQFASPKQPQESSRQAPPPPSTQPPPSQAPLPVKGGVPWLAKAVIFALIGLVVRAALSGSGASIPATARLKTPTPVYQPRVESTQVPGLEETSRPITSFYGPCPVGWDYCEDFENQFLGPQAGSDEVSSGEYRDGQFVLETHTDQTVWYTPRSTGTKNGRIRVELAATRGSGAVVILIETKGGEPIWAFYVSPSSQEWSVGRYSLQRDGLFEWVTPRSFSGQTAEDGLRSIEAQIVDGLPKLLINNADVMTPLGISLEPLSGEVAFGYGASGTGFEVTFDSVKILWVGK